MDYLAEPLLAGIHAGDVDRLSVRALFPRLVDAERQSGSIVRAFRALRMKPSPQGAFVSLPGGIAELVDALVRAIPSGAVVTGARVTDLRHAGTYTLDTSHGGVQARAVILALPAYAAGGILDYWVLDLNGRQLHVFRDPQPLPAALSATAYQTRDVLGPGDTISPLAASAATIRVADLLP